MAWRANFFRFLKDGVQIQDCDDDGESAAGSRLLHLLQVKIFIHNLYSAGFYYR